jgi:pilus assembly protein CpaE
MTAELAERIVDIVRERYTHVVIDLPRAALDWVEPVVRASDRLLLVSDGSVPCIRQAKRMLDLYRELDPNLTVDVVMNRERKPLLGSGLQRDAEDLLQIKIGDWLSKDETGERRAIDLGRPSVCRRSRNRNNFRRLARRLLASPGDKNIKSGK